MPGDEAEETVRVLARELGVAIKPEHLGEVAGAWRLMGRHLDLVRSAELEPELEPASLFRP